MYGVITKNETVSQGTISDGLTVIITVGSEDSSDGLTVVLPADPSGLTVEEIRALIDASHSDPSVHGEIYGAPYGGQLTSTYAYYSWQHVDGTQWKAQRIDINVMSIVEISGVNPQPFSISEFEALTWA